ncbi:Vomp family autotransporter [Bartonella bacilliformis]|uniref:Vomp family autotransporter n=1 Tax=Bartonella bacilliformis TaxID=774 RepID=UPI0007AF1186|nr:Vomp family autotransporter [Bartonella bacilliformis]KZM37994.1 hypothetical protein AWH67_03230 [Bartonella bacilliformis]
MKKNSTTKGNNLDAKGNDLDDCHFPYRSFLFKAVILGTAMTALLSSVALVFPVHSASIEETAQNAKKSESLKDYRSQNKKGADTSHLWGLNKNIALMDGVAQAKHKTLNVAAPTRNLLLKENITIGSLMNAADRMATDSISIMHSNYEGRDAPINCAISFDTPTAMCFGFRERMDSQDLPSISLAHYAHSYDNRVSDNYGSQIDKASKEGDVQSDSSRSLSKEAEGEEKTYLEEGAKLADILNDTPIVTTFMTQDKPNLGGGDVFISANNSSGDKIYSRFGIAETRSLDDLLCNTASKDILCIGQLTAAKGFASVALGYGSQAIRGPNVAGYDPITDGISTSSDYLWKSTHGELGIGNMDIKRSRQITGVAAGREDNEAVNVAQLKALRKWVQTRDTDISDIIQFRLLNVYGSGQISIGWDKASVQSISVNHKNGDKRYIEGIRDGVIASNSSMAVTGGQLYSAYKTVEKFLGGGASFGVGGFGDKQPIFNIQGNRYRDVGAAFDGVDNSFSKFDKSIEEIKNDISSAMGDSLVKQDVKTGIITIGSEKEGTVIDIANSKQETRQLTGLKAGIISQNSTDAVTGGQLWTTREKVNALDTNIKVAILDIAIVKNDVSILETNVNNAAANISQYLGSYADVLKGVAPIYEIQGQTYRDVGAAFAGVDDSFGKFDKSIEEIKNDISSAMGDSLVKQDVKTGIITIGSEKEGTVIDIANSKQETRQLTGLKAGIISQNSTDAVTGGQLWTTREKVNALDTNIKAAVLDIAILEGDVSILETNVNNAAANISQYLGGYADVLKGVAPIYEIQGQTYRDISSAFDGVDKFLTKINSGNLEQDALLWSDEENAFVALHAAEKGKKSQNSKLKFLLDGDVSEGSTEAITGNQLYVVSNQLALYLGGGAGYNNGQWIAPTFKVAQFSNNGSYSAEKTYNNVADAFDGVNKSMADINNRVNEATQNGGKDSLNWNENIGTFDASHNGKPGAVTNVADGKVEQGSKDAINGGQLWDVKEDVKGVQNQVNDLKDKVNGFDDKLNGIENAVDDMKDKIKDATDGVVSYDKDKNGKKTNKITLQGGDESKPVTLDNVADGKVEKGSQEAVNGGQLHDYTKEKMQLVLDDAKKYTDEKIKNIVVDFVDEAVAKAKDYTDQKFNVLSYEIDGARKEARQGAAIGLAVSNLRYDDTPGKFSLAFGAGMWRGESAVALGSAYTSENGRVRSNLSATSGGGHWGVGAGLSLTLN